MVLICKVVTSVLVYHKLTGEPIEVKNEVIQEVEEGSGEYEQLCDNFKDVIKVDRDDRREFNKELLKHLAKQVRELEIERIENIKDVFRDCALHPNINGCISFGGFICNPKDFCAIKVNEFSVNLKSKGE